MRAFRKPDVVGVGLDFFEQAGLAEIVLDLFAYRKPVHADIKADLVVDRTVRIEYVYDFEIVFLAYHVVVYVVCRRDFQHSRTELHVDVVVGYDGDGTPYERYLDGMAYHVLVTRVVGIHAQCYVAEYRFRACCGYDHVAVAALDHVAQVVEFALRFAEYHLFVGQGSLRGWVPVDHSHAAVYQSFVVQVYEYPYHAGGTYLVHCERGAFPVARSTQSAQLFKNYAAVFLLPLPCAGEELLSGERGFLYALLLEHGHHFGLGGDGSVVGAGYPAGVEALHAGAAHEYVLYGVVEHVSHVQYACHVGRRYDNSVCRPAIGNRVEVTLRQPVFVPFGFYILRRVFVLYIHIQSLMCLVSMI